MEPRKGIWLSWFFSTSNDDQCNRWSKKKLIKSIDLALNDWKLKFGKYSDMCICVIHLHHWIWARDQWKFKDVYLCDSRSMKLSKRSMKNISLVLLEFIIFHTCLPFPASLRLTSGTEDRALDEKFSLSSFF